MKIAYVHDWLNYPWWAEKVFFDIVQDKMKEIFNKNKYNIKEEKIFTNFYNTNYRNPTNIPIESVISSNKIQNYYRNLMPFFPIITKKLSKKIEKYNPDLVVISSFAIWKNIDINCKKILYLHSPMQYIWSHYDEYVSRFTWLKQLLYKFSSKYLKSWDKKYTNFDKIYFNSSYTRQLFNDIYDKNSNWKIVHPIVGIPNFKKVDIYQKYDIKGEYYIYIWRLVKFVKHVDNIIKIFNKTWKQLIIVWDGPDEKYLKSIAKKNIKFLGYLQDYQDDYWNLLKNSKALINLTKESFWIVNYQAWKIWTKIISLNHGAINDIPWEKILIEKFEDLEKIIWK